MANIALIIAGGSGVRMLRTYLSSFLQLTKNQ